MHADFPWYRAASTLAVPQGLVARDWAGSGLPISGSPLASGRLDGVEAYRDCWSPTRREGAFC